MITRFLKIAGLLGALSVFTLSADPLAVAKANVPFEFSAGGSMLPAGEYSVDRPDFSGVIALHGPQGSSLLLLTIASDGTSSTAPKLLFERHDGMAYLAGVEGTGMSVKLPITRLAKPTATASLH